MNQTLRRGLIIITVFSLTFLAGNVGAQTWTSIGSITGGIPYYVVSFGSYNNSLVIGGAFTAIGGTPANNIALWDGTNFTALGSGLSALPNGFAEYNNKLYAAGWFDTAGGVPARRVASWDGTNWASIGNGTASGGAIMRALCVYNGNLYLAGHFDTIGGVPANNIAMWNGTTWAALGTGLNYDANALIVHDNKLFVGGSFSKAGGITTGGIAIWDGTNWANGTNGIPDANNLLIDAFAEMKGVLYEGGYYDTLGLGVFTGSMKQWDGTTWSTVGVGIDSPITSLAAYNGRLYAGGYFKRSGTIRPAHVAVWDGETWATVDSGTNGVIYALASYNGYLYAGGSFDTAGGQPLKRLARLQTTPLSGIQPEPSVGYDASIFPNPGNGLFNINLIQETDAANVEVFDLLGQQILHAVLQPGVAKIDLTAYPNGVYLYRVTSSSDKHVVSQGKVIKE